MNKYVPALLLVWQKRQLALIALIAVIAASAWKAAAAKTWAGGASGHQTDWNTAANWNTPGVPGSSDDVTIPTGRAFYPLIAGAAVCHNLTLNGGTVIINSGGSLVMGNRNLVTASGTSLTIHSGGSLSINGDANSPVGSIVMDGGVFTFGGNNLTIPLILTGGTVIFSSIGQAIPGGTYYNLELSGPGSPPDKLGGNITVIGNLAIDTGVHLNVNKNLATANTLTLGGVVQTAGTSSDPIFFTAGSSVTVAAGPAARLVFTTGPASTPAGATMANVVVRIQDASGNNVASNNVPVSVSLSTGSFASGNTTTNTGADGSAMFNNLAINTARSYTMTASASGFTSAASGSFNITALAASKLVFTSSPLTITAGAPSSMVTVQRQDSIGNPNTNGATITVNLTSSSTGGNFLSADGSATITSVNILSGSSSASFLYRDTMAGTPTITNSAIGLLVATQRETVNSAAPAISGVTASQSISYGIAGVTLNGTVSAAGPVYPTDGETVAITINGSAQNATISGGAGSFSASFSTAAIPASGAAYTILYAYTGDANLNAANDTSTTLTVNKGVLALTPPGTSTITYGQTLASSILNGGAATSVGNNSTVPGAFAFANPGLTPNQGATNVSVTFTPNDTADYSAATATVTVTVLSANHPPVIAPITNAIIQPDGELVALVDASDPDGDHLTITVDTGAPAGLSVTNLISDFPTLSTNTFIVWTPTRAFASTTNVVTLRVTDDGVPPMSATQTFTVTVLDYLDISMTSTNVIEGNYVEVPIYLSSSDGVTNLEFSVPWPASYFSNATLLSASPGIVFGTLQDQVTNLLITLQATAGQALQTTQQMAELRFVAISNQLSAFVPLPIQNAVASKPNGSVYTNYLAEPGTVAVVENQALLKLVATLSAGHRDLTLFGKLGFNYQLQYSTNLALPNWYSWTDYTQTNEVMTMRVDSPLPVIFYRVWQSSP